MDFFKEQIIPGEVLVQLLAFLIVFWGLKRMAWGPILKALESRRNKIQSSFDEIETTKAQLEKMKADYSAHLQKIDEEARAKIQDAVDEGRKIGRDIQEKARADAQAVFEKSKENLDIEVAKARLQLKRDIADLSIQVTEKILREKMSGEIQQEKILAMIDEVGSAIDARRNK